MSMQIDTGESVRVRHSPRSTFIAYAERLGAVLEAMDWSPVEELAEELADCTVSRRQVFLAGNGGSAGNAIHLANDLIYGVAKSPGRAIRATALSANASVITCLANDEGYDRIFEIQLAELAEPGDVLVVLSGSGNSPNVLRVLQQARRMKVKTYAILGYDGGAAKELADVVIHAPLRDMQISEDVQLIVFHMIMQWLFETASLRAGSREQ